MSLATLNALRCATGDAFGAGSNDFCFFRWTQRAHGCTGAPHFAVTESGEFFGDLLRIILGATNFNDAFGFCTGGNALVEFFEYRQRSFLEVRFPVKRAALVGGAAILIHPVHAVFIHQTNK